MKTSLFLLVVSTALNGVAADPPSDFKPGRDRSTNFVPRLPDTNRFLTNNPSKTNRLRSNAPAGIPPVKNPPDNFPLDRFPPDRFPPDSFPPDKLLPDHEPPKRIDPGDHENPVKPIPPDKTLPTIPPPLKPDLRPKLPVPTVPQPK